MWRKTKKAIEYSVDKYLPRTVLAVLWAFFLEKLAGLTRVQKIDAFKECLEGVGDEFEQKGILLEAFYSKEDFDLVKRKIQSFEEASERTDYLFSDYDKHLHALNYFSMGKFPIVIQDQELRYEYESEKMAEKHLDCFEAKMLYFFSVVWYDSARNHYGDYLLPEERRNGEGFRKLRKALKYFYLADIKKIERGLYSFKYDQEKFTSLGKLKQLGLIGDH